MTSVFATKITKVYNALINRINDSIATHNTSNNAHSSLFNNKANVSDLTSIENRVGNLEDELQDLEEDLLA